MKILFIFIVLGLLSGCATDPINTDRFQDYIPWWHSSSNVLNVSNIANSSTNNIK
jgi:hypothetical protein